jgi:hypothetical protein
MDGAKSLKIGRPPKGTIGWNWVSRESENDGSLLKKKAGGGGGS